MGSLRLLIADDHEIFRAGLRSLLEGQPQWRIVAEASNGREAVEKASKTHPDVALLDIGMPILNGLEAARQIADAEPRTKIVILTVHDSDVMIHGVLRCGVRGYLFKADAARDLVRAIKAVRDDATFFTDKVAETILNGFARICSQGKAGGYDGRLTPRQREITKLLAEGCTTKEVAASLRISLKTAETHRANLMHRANCGSAADLVRYAVRNQIIEA